MTRRTICPNCDAIHLVGGELPERMRCLKCEMTFFPFEYAPPAPKPAPVAPPAPIAPAPATPLPVPVAPAETRADRSVNAAIERNVAPAASAAPTTSDEPTASDEPMGEALSSPDAASPGAGSPPNPPRKRPLVRRRSAPPSNVKKPTGKLTAAVVAGFVSRPASAAKRDTPTPISPAPTSHTTPPSDTTPASDTPPSAPAKSSTDALASPGEITVDARLSDTAEIAPPPASAAESPVPVPDSTAAAKASANAAETYEVSASPAPAASETPSAATSRPVAAIATVDDASASLAAGARIVKATRLPPAMPAAPAPGVNLWTAIAIGFLVGGLTVAGVIFGLGLHRPPAAPIVSPASPDASSATAAAGASVAPTTPEPRVASTANAVTPANIAAPANAAAATGPNAGAMLGAPPPEPKAVAVPSAGPLAAVPAPPTEAEQYFSFAELAAHPVRVGETSSPDAPLLPAFQRLLGLSQTTSESLRRAAAELARTQAHYFAAGGLPIDAAGLTVEQALPTLQAALDAPGEIKDAAGRRTSYRDPRGPFATRGLGAYIDAAAGDDRVQRARLQGEPAREAAWSAALPIAERISQAAPPRRPAISLSATLGDRDKLIPVGDPLASLVKATRDSLGVVYALQLAHDGREPLANVTLAVELTDVEGVVKRGRHFVREWPAKTPLIPDPLPGWEGEPAGRIVAVSWQAWSENAPPIQGEATYPEHLKSHLDDLLSLGDGETALAAIDGLQPLLPPRGPLTEVFLAERQAVEELNAARRRHFSAFEIGRRWTGSWTLASHHGWLELEVREAAPDPLREPGVQAVTFRLFEPRAEGACEIEAILGGYDPARREFFVEANKVLDGMPDDGKLEPPRSRDYLVLDKEERINTTRKRRFVVLANGRLIGACADGTLFDFSPVRFSPLDGPLPKGAWNPLESKDVFPPAPTIEPFPERLLPAPVPVNAGVAAVRGNGPDSAYGDPGELGRFRVAPAGRALKDGEKQFSRFVGFEEGGHKLHFACSPPDSPAPTMFTYEVKSLTPYFGLKSPKPLETRIEGLAAYAWCDLQTLLPQSPALFHETRVQEALARVTQPAFDHPPLGKLLRQEPQPTRLTWSPQLNALAWLQDDSAMHFDFASHSSRRLSPAADLGKPFPTLTALCYSSDGKMLLGAAADGTVRCFDLVRAFAEKRYTPPPIDPNDVRPRRVIGVWSHPGTTSVMLLVYQGNDPERRATGDYELHLWQPPRDEPQRPGFAVRVPWKNPSLTPSCDWRRLVVAQDDRLSVWDMTTGQELHRCLGLTRRVRHTAISPDGRLVAAMEESSRQPWLVVWRVPGSAEEAAK